VVRALRSDWRGEERSGGVGKVRERVSERERRERVRGREGRERERER
jgi:hypothetical protein